MQASDFTQDQLLELGTLAADMLDDRHDGDTIKAHLVIMAEDFKAAPEFVQVFVVTYEGVTNLDLSGGYYWNKDETTARERFNTDVSMFGKTHVVALWSAYVPAEWSFPALDDFIDDTFVSTVPSGYPIQVHNAPSDNWPHEDDQA